MSDQVQIVSMTIHTALGGGLTPGQAVDAVADAIRGDSSGGFEIGPDWSRLRFELGDVIEVETMTQEAFDEMVGRP